MRILVTGASEYIGARLALDLMANNHLVRVHGQPGPMLEALVKQGAEAASGSLAEVEQARRLCDDVDAVAHCTDAVGTLSVAALEASSTFIEACLHMRVSRLVYVSSSRVYERGGQALKEDQAPDKPRTLEAQRRLQVERLALTASEFGLEVIVLRPAMIVGLPDTVWAPRLISLNRQKRLRLQGNGLNRWDFISMSNLCKAVELALLTEHPDAMNKVYNLSEGQSQPVWDVVNYLMRRLKLPILGDNGPRLSTRSLLAGWVSAWRQRDRQDEPDPVWLMTREFTLDIARAQALLDYHPQGSLWKALDEYIEHRSARR
ncbi:nucleoside-diphosphate-sugar epimerase [Pseudomonas duriflava]|uniref:Nucleoside-diphosphate-sugar epimerase n=1 Tax=Pseudomonas duriflava TaxID=459528 RepID=A0A562QP26_9PSED|nr:NAD(P)-dependent oxidoreductase [Pseudomonas duriflava]TWI58511.1 nucleoside-diphosphate-sugar epimerase [Pseudomonas duriflava]